MESFDLIMHQSGLVTRNVSVPGAIPTIVGQLGGFWPKGVG